MNLFVLAWNISSELSPNVIAELRNMTDIYPQLDLNSLWHWHKKNEEGEHVAASVHTSKEVSAPRRYVYQSNKQITFYDGCMVDPGLGFRAYDAKALADHWHELADTLEGWFTVVRLVDEPLSVQILNDINGIGPVYYLHRNDSWLVSNSIELIARIANAHEMDTLGISMFLTLGYVGAARTLLSDIKLMPGGEIWEWQSGRNAPVKKEYYPVTKLLRQPQQPFLHQDYKVLSDKLISICRQFSFDFGELLCPLTGGRDSRLMASLMVGGGISSSFFTDGMPGSDDVESAKLIAEMLKLPHTVNVKTSEDIFTNWNSLCLRLIQQTDGMITLRQISDMLESQYPDRLRIKLWGVGGELARGKYTKPQFFFRKFTKQELSAYMIRALISDHGGMVRGTAKETVQEIIQQFVMTYFDQCPDALDILDVYRLIRTRYFMGASYRKNNAIFDRFSPFFTRPFIEAVFAIPAAYRYSEPFHYHLVKMLVPKLHQLPIYPRSKGGWRSQRPSVNMLRAVTITPLQTTAEKIQRRLLLRHVIPCFDHWKWLETKRKWFRELCLDQSDSQLWSIIDRPKFESYTSSKTAPQKLRAHLQGIYQITTLFYYFSKIGC